MHELPLDRKRVEALADKARHFNVFPMHLDRYTEGKHPITPLLADLVAEAGEYLSALSVAEVRSVRDNLPSWLKMMADEEPGSDSDIFRSRLALYCVMAAVQNTYFSLKRVVEEDLDDSEVLKVYPELGDRLDKDGLLPVDDELILHDGGIEYRDHMLHYHQLLRRGYRSNPNFHFLGRLSSYHRRTRPANSFRVAIDHRRIMPKEYYARMIELDTWYGPPFDPAKLDDPKAVGLTVVVRNKDSLFELDNHLERTEFFWSYRNGVKSFEVEEISSTGYEFDAYYLNKYVHSERAIEKGVTGHLDGAVKVYLNNSYQDRMDSKLPKEAKCFRKIKLWRIDGDIDLENWIDLICFFFKSNEMLIEHFNPDEFEKIFELRVRDFKEWKRQQAQGAEST